MPRGRRRAEVEVGARSRKLDAELRKARKKFQRWGKRTRGDLKRSFAGVRRNLSTVVGFGGVAVFGAMAKRTFEFEKSLTRLQIQSGKSRAFMDGLRRSIRSMSDETGVASDELLAGAAQYVSLTGDIDGASEALGTFARTAAASGASMGDIAATAAALRSNLKIDPKDFEKGLSILLTQGKAGAVELKDLASLMSTVGSQFPDFGRTGVEGLAELGAMLQGTRLGFGSAKEAVTGYMGMMTAFTKNAKRFRKAGVDVFTVGADGSKQLRPVHDIIADISNSKLMKDPEALQKAFGRTEGRRAFQMIAKNRDMYLDLVEAGLASNAVQEDFLTFQESAAGRQARAWQRLQNTIAKTITPQRIEMFAEAMEKLADLVAWVADNATAIGIAFASWKVGKGLGALVSLVGSLKGAGGLGGLLNTGSMNAIPVTIVAAGAAGAAVGTALDKYTGFSEDFGADKRRSLAAGGKVDQNAPVSVQLRQMAQIERNKIAATKSGSGITRREDLSMGQRALRAFAFGTGSGQAGLMDKRFQVGTESVAASKRIVDRLEAQARAHESVEKVEQTVRVIVDRNGLLNIEQDKKRRARSQPR